MKVNCVNKYNLSFTAGKVSLYSDFDGTYFPAGQKDLHNIDKANKDLLNENLRELGDFLENTKSDLTAKITTGRTFGEFASVSEQAQSKGISIPYPSSFISKNGSDEYLRTSQDLFADNFPYERAKINLKKEQNIEKLTGWNKSIKSKLDEILKVFHFNIVEHDSEHSVIDHGAGSLFSQVEYDKFELTDNMQPRSNWTVGVRKDGNLKLNISFPYDMLHVAERKAAYDEIKATFEKFLSDENVKFISKEFVDTAGGNRPTLEYYPAIDGTALTKLYDTKEAFSDAVKNNNLLITAGDGINDYYMLNPLNYLDTKIDIKDIENPEIAERIRRLPFVGIVIKGENSGLEDLYKNFGKFGKIIEVEKGQLKNGIVLAISQYAKDNPDFLSNMSQNLISELNPEILKTVEQTVEQIAEEAVDVVSNAEQSIVKNTSKSTNGGKIFAFLTGIGAAIAGMFIAFKPNNQNNEKGGNQNENS